MDATLGGGGHASEILKIIGKGGKLIAIDQDGEAIENFKKFIRLGGQSPSEAGNVIFVKDNFSNLQNILGGVQILAVDAILADLGYSSLQMEDAERGMSFLAEGELDMRLDREAELTAKKIVNEYPEAELKKILKEFGEEKFATSIARKIVQQRKIKLIEKTTELADIIISAVPEQFRHGKMHPATKTFQALRIETNKELEALAKFLPQAIDALSAGGRLGVISFHSLEDRIVKNMFRENARGCICPPDFPECVCGREPKVHPVKYGEAVPPQAEFNRVKIITKKPIVPSQEEIADNPRSRSAKLRICEKL